MIYIVITFFMCLASAISRDVGRNLKTLPAVTNSLVNLGKMDISFHFNMRPQDFPDYQKGFTFDTLFGPKKEDFREPCPCSSLKYLKDPSQNHPADLLNRILSGNDLFSFKEPASSPLCCDSHENIHEDILLEFSPKKSQIVVNPQNSDAGFSFLPYLLDSLQNRPRPSLPTMPVKSKAVEILLFPKKTGMLPLEFNKLIEKKKNLIKKDAIKVVGDKFMKNDFKTGLFVPPLPTTKKDVSIEESANVISKNGGEVKSKVDNKVNTV